MRKLKSYKLKITALSPIHIGTGEVYDPTNFVIDSGYLYEFDEILFYKSLNTMDKKSLDAKLGNYMQIINFYKEHAKLAKEIYVSKIKVSKKVEETYKKTINADGSKNKNQLEIQKTYKNPNTNFAVIPGSSLKGMLDTILQIYPKKIADNSVRQDLILSDAFILNGQVDIGYSYRRHKNPQKKARSPIPQIVEVIKANSVFIFSMDTKFDFKDISEAAKRYFKAIGRKNTFFKSGEDKFVARVGKFSGKAFMMDDGSNVLNNDRKPVATHTLYEDYSEFGWINIELINNEEYENAINNIQNHTQKYFDDLKMRQKEIKNYIESQNKQKKRIEEEKRAREEQEKFETEKKIKEEQERQAKLSPFERKIDEIIKNHPNKNETEDVIILHYIKNGELKEFKYEALSFVKNKMMELKKWVENSIKPQKDKKYKRTQEVIEMLKKIEEKK